MVSHDFLDRDARTAGDGTLFQRVAIAGVGLIGGSIGLALKQRGNCHVLGIGRNPNSLDLAQRMGAVDEATIGFGPVLADYDLLILAAPVDRIAEHYRLAADHLAPSAVCTDAGSTKAELVAAIEAEIDQRRAQGRPAAAFVGSHPMAGSEQRGPTAARADLFEDRVCILTPTPATDVAARDRVAALWRHLGMQLVECSPREHDDRVALTSHLPHVAASALGCLVGPQLGEFVGTGFLDTTRVAAGDPDLWAAICEANRAALADAVAQYQAELDRFRYALQHQDRNALKGWFDVGKQHRDALGSRPAG